MKVPGARFDAGTKHDDAMDWAASLARRLDHMDRSAILAEWNGHTEQTHRETLKHSGPDLLRQLVAYVRARLDELPKPESSNDA